MAKRKILFILTIILGIFPLLLFTFAFAAHAESTSETPRQLCADARKDGSYTILEDTQDRCVYVSPGVIKIEHFYQGNQLCLRTTGFKEALTFGLVFVSCGFITDGFYALTASGLREVLVKGRALPFVQRYVAGVVFVALGIVAASAKIS